MWWICHYWFLCSCFSSDFHSCHRCPSLSSLSLLYFLPVPPLILQLFPLSCILLCLHSLSLLLSLHPFWLSHPPFLCHSCSVSDVMMVCCGRALDSPCTLALLVGFQFAFVLYFSLGGFRGLVSVLVHSTEPEIDYSRPHDVYTNLTSLLLHHPGPSGPEQQLRDCTLPSPLLGRYKSTLKWLRRWSIIGFVHSLCLIAVFRFKCTKHTLMSLVHINIKILSSFIYTFICPNLWLFLLWITHKNNILNVLVAVFHAITMKENWSFQESNRT